MKPALAIAFPPIDDPWEMMIFRRLREAADAGEDCPTCDDLADLIGANAVATTVGVMQRLERKGLILVERYQRTRRVTIVATGAQTREPVNQAPHWREIAVTLGTLRKQRPAEANAIVFEAARRKMRVADFLSDLIWAGWTVIQTDMAQA